jgi:hypothetical protein
MKPETADGLVAILCLTALVLWCLLGPGILGVKDVAGSVAVAVVGSFLILKAGDVTLTNMRKSRTK